MRNIEGSGEASKSPDEKRCLWCSAPFYRGEINLKTGKKKHETSVRWNGRKCCSRSCSAKERNARPEYRLGLQEARAKWLSDPENAEKMRAISKENRLKGARKSGRMTTQKWLGWCPEDYRQVYRDLRRKIHLTREEAVEIVKQSVEDDARNGISRAEREMREKHRRQLADAY